jgi:hypothetical protein
MLKDWLPVKTIKMIRAIRDQQYEETRNMTAEQKLLYFQKRANEFRKQLAARGTASKLIKNRY